MPRTEFDTFIRHLAQATNLDFYYVERMLKGMIRNEVEKQIKENEEKKSPA